VTQISPGRDVVVAGVGLHPFGRFPEKDLGTLALEAVLPALQDAGVGWKRCSGPAARATTSMPSALRMLPRLSGGP